MSVLNREEIAVYPSRLKDSNALYESSLSRVWQHSKKGFFTISAFRDTYDLKENLKRHDQLKQAVRGQGLGFFEIDGSYVYDDGTIGSELSLFVPYMDTLTVEEFTKRAILLGKKFNQESILLFTPEGGGWLYYMSGKEEKVGSLVSLDKFKQFFSALKKGNHKGRRFVVEGSRIASSIMSAQTLYQEGMIILKHNPLRLEENKEFGKE